MIQTLDKIDGYKVKLCVPLVASYLLRGIRQADIARICNVSPQAVNDYIKRHSDQLAPLVDGENILIMKAKHIASKAQENIITILDDTPEKKDMIALNAISGTHIDKYRILSDKSSINININQVTTNRKDVEDRITVLQERLKELKGRTDNSVEMGNKPEIVDVNGE